MLNHHAQHIVGGLAADGDLWGEGDAVAEDGEGGGFDIAGGDVVAAVEQGVGFGDADEADGATGAGTEADGTVTAGGAGEGNGVLDDAFDGLNGGGFALGGEDVGGGADGLQMIGGKATTTSLGGDGADDVCFLLSVRIIDQDLDEEAVELSLRERVGAFLLDGVLRGEGHEGRGERVGLAIDGDLIFLHDLEQSRLGFGRRTVDLIGQEELGENGALADAEGLGGKIKQSVAGDVGGHQIGGELDAAEVAAKGAGEGEHEVGFAETRFALEQNVTASEQGGDDLINDIVLADENLSDGLVNRLKRAV